MVIVLTAALVTGASLAIPLQHAKAWQGNPGWYYGGGYGYGNPGSYYGGGYGPHVNILSHSNQANECSGNMAFCLNKLTNIDCVHSICIIGDISPWKMATPLPTATTTATK